MVFTCCLYVFIGALIHDGPPPPVAPAWIHWGINPSPPVDDVSAEAEDVTDPETEDDRWVPFLQPHRKRARDDDSDDSSAESSSDEEEPAVFPYPVGTRVARSFGEDGIFWGTIVKHYGDDHTLCVVRYTDGDQEDMDKDEVSYTVGLYRQEFSPEEAE